MWVPTIAILKQNNNLIHYTLDSAMSINLIRMLSLTYVVALLCPCLDCSLVKRPAIPLPVNNAGRENIALASPATPLKSATIQPTLAAAPTPTDTASFDNYVTLDNLSTSADTVTPVISGTPTTPAALSSPVISDPLPSCMWATCNLFFQVGIVPLYLFSAAPNEWQYESVYYWPPKSQNTACLSTMLSPVGSAPPIGLDMYYIELPRHDIRADNGYSQSPSIYVVYNSVTAYNSCSRIGSTYANITTSFPPGSLSTIRTHDGSIHSFDFADLPCPPPGVEWTSTEPYAPLVSPPSFLFHLDPAFADCIPAFHQGVDPSITLSPVIGGITDRKSHLHNKAIGRDLVVPWAPRKTAEHP